MNILYDKILTLLNQIIEKNIYYDLLNKERTDTGDSWDVHHLKLLRDLIEEYGREKNAKN
jgi:hypothetical protein